MRIIYLGTPEFAVAPLQMLVNKAAAVVGVVTQPDRPKGRGKKLHASPVKIIAEFNNIPVFYPDQLSSALDELKPDLLWVVAYGNYIPLSLTKKTTHGCVNIHPSLLPKYRGAAPVHRQIINGETVSGITVHYISKEIDAGNIILKKTIAIDPNDTTLSLTKRLSYLAAECVIETNALIVSGNVTSVEQDHSQFTYAEKLTKNEGEIDWTQSAINLHNKIRGMFPWPSAYTFINGVQLKILSAQIVDDELNGSPGEIRHVEKRLLVSTGKGSLELLRVQLENRSAVDVHQFLAGYRELPPLFDS